MDLNDFNRKLIEEYRANGGRVTGRFAGAQLLLLTTTGASSGKPRTTPLVFGMDDDRIFIIASFAGGPKHPAWYGNLLAHPEVTVELGRDSFQARAVVAGSAERDRLYGQQAAKMPTFNDYQAKTTRVIPVVLLERTP